jgi:hypothetical protein
MDGTGEHHLKLGSESQNLHVLPHMQIVDLRQVQQYYGMQVSLRGGHAWENQGKERKLKNLNMVDVLSVQE